MSQCGWCGRELIGDPVLPYEQTSIVHGHGEVEEEVLPGFRVGFCSNGCAWAFNSEIHRIFGLSGNELRSHLIDVEGLTYPPGKPSGNQSVACFNRLRSVALSYVRAFNFDGGNN